MKKNLLTIALVAGALLPASAQWYQVGGTVKVKPNTLKYVSGDHSVKGAAKESNEGWVNVRGNFDVESTAEFRNEFNTPTEYGQLIIADASTSTGKVVGEYKTPGANTFYKAALAVPYVEVTADQLATMAGINTKQWQNHAGDGNFSANRWRNPVNVWDNKNYALDDLAATDKITQDGDYKPTAYYTVNNKVDNLDYRQTNYSGTPANKAHVLDMTRFKVDGRTDYKRNKFGESFGTYLKDPFVDVDYAEWSTVGQINRPEGFGENYFYFGNPYTSNVDLTEKLKESNVVGVVQYTSVNFDENTNQGNGVLGDVTFNQIATYDNGSSSFTGDASILKIRPYHAFGVKTKVRTDLSVTLNDEVKTFTEDAASPKYTARVSRRSGLKQVQIKLRNTDNQELYRTYVVASTSFEAEGKAGNQAYITDISERQNAIYTLEETQDGGVSESFKGVKVYINGVNEIDYVGKPIYLVNQVATPGKFIYTFNLSEGVNGGNKFYFEDKETGDIKEITSDFTYTFNASETTTDRFCIYWNDKPVTRTLASSDLKVQETVVYRDYSNTYKIKFANDLKSADVYVYNVLGQLVHSKKSVNTVVDYVLPLDNSSVAYVVKIVGDNGVVTTKKIVK